MDDFEIELKNDFLEESEELLASAEGTFLDLEHSPDDPELLNQIFRLAHNLKGTSKAVGFDQLAGLTHIAENLILKLKNGEVQTDAKVVSVLLQFKDKVEEIILALKDDHDALVDTEQVERELELVTNQTAEEIESAPASQADSETLDDVEAGLEAIPDESAFPTEAIEESEDTFITTDQMPMNQDALDALRELTGEDAIIDEIIAEPIVEPKPVQAAPKPKAPVAKTKGKAAANEDETIRVKLSRIDHLTNVVGELVILQTVLSQRRFEHITDELSNKSIGMMGKLFKEVQELSMSLRMLPLKPIFQKMNRIVRDTSNALSKDVKLNLIGEDTEIDKTVLEHISDPLVHIVRNAVDHGLEDTETRIAAGKPAQGVVDLMAFHEGSNLVIQVTDDGKGIDPDIIRQKAIEKGVLNASSDLTPKQIIQLIFHPGFSTKEQVTEVSGRGVGMDVVKTNIELLGGEVELTSEVGKGSKLKIVLPLTLAIIEGIIVKSEEHKYVIPLSQIFEIIQLKSDKIESFPGIASLFKLRGEALPLFHLNNKLGHKPSEKESRTVIVIRGLSHAFGVEVDDIIHQQQIVIKKLGADLQNKVGIMGSAIMSDGKPSLIIDLFEIFKNDLKASKGYKKYNKKIRATA